MSEGHFEYNQYRIEDIAIEIDNLIKNNSDGDLDEYGGRYPPEIIERFREESHTLRRAAEMA